MTHLRARRLLAALLDGTLPEPTEGALRDHVGCCRRCSRHLGELEATEWLVRRLPLRIVSCEGAVSAELRLAGLARWWTDPAGLWRERFGLSALGAVVAAAALLLSLTVSQSWAPLSAEPAPVAVLAAAEPASTFLPLGWR